MNRRTYLKGTLSAITLGLIAVPVFKWIGINKAVGVKCLKEKEAVISELVELIIPETDTPGAKKAGVQHFVIGMVTNCLSIRQQNKFMSGIEALERHSIKKYQNEFVKCSEGQKNDVLKYFEENDVYSFQILNRINNKFFGGAFYSTLKYLTVEGYCMSRLGATEGLAYDYIPGTFEACVPLLPGQKTWATK